MGESAQSDDGVVEASPPTEPGPFVDRREAGRRRWKKFWRVARRVFVVLFVIVLIPTLWLTWRLTLSPSPSVDYREQLNAAARAVPEDQRSWPLYREVLLEMEPLPEFEGLPHPSEDRWDEVEVYLESQQEFIEKLRQASRLEGFGLILGYDYPPEDLELWPHLAEDDLMFGNWLGEGALWEVVLPHIQGLRDLNTALLLDAHRAAAYGDGATAIEDLRAACNMAIQLREHPILLIDLISNTRVLAAASVAGELLAKDAELFTDEQLESLAEMIDLPDSKYIPRFIWERRSAYDLVQRTYSDNGKGDGRLTLKGARAIAFVEEGWSPQPSSGEALAGVMKMFQAASRRETLEVFDQLYDFADQQTAIPLWELDDDSMFDAELGRFGLDPSRPLQHPVVTISLFSLDRALMSAQFSMGRRDAMKVAVALEQYRRAHGDWPSSLEELVPRLLAVVPPDRFDGEPLRYVMVDGQPVLYSVGADRDDDGGRPAIFAETGEPDPDAATKWVAPSELEAERASGDLPDGDWILWPPPEVGTHAPSAPGGDSG